MHRELRKLLHDAEGQSGFVVAIFLDVRGFSSFARMTESSETAVFLRSVYLTILEDFFPESDFFKPTGDGLMIIRKHTASDLEQVASESVARALDLVDAFPKLCDSDKMVNFPVPGDLGIGLARGAATQLISHRKTLDYSGRPLNLAARLMDLARPRGVVMESSIADLLNENLLDRFRQEQVYVKGIAEDDPVSVQVTEETTIPEANTRPMGSAQWVVECEESIPFKELKLRRFYIHTLSREPADRKTITLHVSHKKVLSSGRPHRSMFTTWSFEATYLDDGSGPTARMDYQAIKQTLMENGVKDSWPINLEIRYRAVPT
jgi:class 3 adenylate cyclase